LENKIENQLYGTEISEYGYAGYDLAYQRHLIHQYKNQFDLINHVITGFRFEDGLTSSEYQAIRNKRHYIYLSIC
jgi:hypothetical protein